LDGTIFDPQKQTVGSQLGTTNENFPLYEKDSPNFIFECCVSTEEKLVLLGVKKIVIVQDSKVGISYNKGKLVVSFFFSFAIEKKKKVPLQALLKHIPFWNQNGEDNPQPQFDDEHRKQCFSSLGFLFV
jgi:hypothetical protein